MYYNPKTEGTKDRKELMTLLNISFPENTEEVQGWHKIHYDPQPVFNPQIKAIKLSDKVELREDGKYYQEWILTDIPLNTVKANKTQEIHEHSNELVAELEKGYTAGEVKTFEQQYLGAKDIQDGNKNTKNALFVIAILKGRLGIEDEPTDEQMALFSQLIINNYTTATTRTAKIIVKQQKLEIDIINATTAQEVADIVWGSDDEGVNDND